MYEYSPKRKNRKALFLTAGLAVFTALCFLYADRFGDYRFVSETAALVSAAIAIMIAGRYLLKDYIYSLRESEAGVDFTVTEVQGKRRTVTCRIGVDEIRNMIKDTPETRSVLSERLQDAKRFDYCVDLAPAEATYLFFADGEKTVAVRISPDEKMESLLRRLSSVGHRSDEE